MEKLLIFSRAVEVSEQWLQPYVNQKYAKVPRAVAGLIRCLERETKLQLVAGFPAWVNLSESL
jgi:hypothetical protein